ncbi:MAG: 16S rRNA (cytosine(1402)-N(4))-methyltransferase RsmH [Saprospiraceae bacterium]|nr:16S rRNA (cytosine(1402)-N(4))-methyltransferase RsmH [Saprospiraceae bacterium]
MTSEYHIPVLLKEAVEGLVINPDGIYVDVTFGGGGHSKAILGKLTSKGRLIAFDQDADAQLNVLDDPRFQLVQANFRYLDKYLRLLNIQRVHGVLADLGVSSHQFDEAGRGFMFRDNVLLDMRMNQQAPRMAKDLLMELQEEELVRIFSHYGEVRNAKTAARRIVEARKTVKIEHSATLMRILDPVVRGSRLRYYAQLFQALRIAVNRELDALEGLLAGCNRIIRKGGRLVVISYHSLEDRLVKHLIRSGNSEGILQKDDYGQPVTLWKAITRKPVEPSEEEIKMNSRARSARMRIAERQ